MTDARQVHRRALVLDSHNDTAVGHILRGNIGLAGERVRGAQPPGRGHQPPAGADRP